MDLSQIIIQYMIYTRHQKFLTIIAHIVLKVMIDILKQQTVI
jgi:hypothetical protein